MKTIFKHIFAYIILLLITGSAVATSYTWTGTTNTDWREGTNWSPNCIGGPSGSDTVIIVSATNNPVLDTNRAIGKLTMTSGTLNLSTWTLNITGKADFNGGTIQGTATDALLPRGTYAIFAGTTFDAEVNAQCGYIQLNGSTFNKVSWLEMTGSTNGLGNGGNTFTKKVTIKNNSTAAFHIAEVSANTFSDTAVFINAGSLELRASDKGKSAFNGNIYINSTSGPVSFGSTGGDTTTLASGKIIEVGSTGFSSGRLTLQRFIQSGGTTQSITLTGSAIFNAVNAIFNGKLTVFAPSILSKESKFYDTLTVKQTGNTNAASPGGNLFDKTVIIQNHGSANLQLATDVGDTFNGDAVFITDSTGNLYPCYKDTNYVKGNLTATGNRISFKAGLTGVVRFSGSSNQIVSGDTTLLFTHVSLKKTAGTVTLSKDIEITGNLQFVKGIVISDTTNLIKMGRSSSVSGTSDSSFVAGPLKKTGNSTFVFPVGKGNYYRAIEISAPSVNTDAFTGEYFDKAQHIGENLDSSLAYLDRCNYWSLLRPTGSSNVYATFYWNGNHCSIDDTLTLKIAHWYNNNWDDLGHGQITGNYSSGKMKTKNTITSYGYFVFAYDTSIINAPNPSDYITAKGFVTNAGQLLGTDTLPHPEIHYYGRAGNTTLFLSDSIFSYVFAKNKIDTTISDSLHVRYKVDTLYRTDMRLMGINTGGEIIPADTSQGYNNYFLGYLDTSYTHALTYQNIKYDNIYDDIDLTFYCGDEFRFNINENGDPNEIRFFYQGTDSVKIDVSNILNLYTKLGSKQYNSKAYQYSEGRWDEFDVHFQKTDSVISFSLGTHEADVPLMIKAIAIPTNPIPVVNPQNILKWSTFYEGSTAGDYLNDVHIDNLNNIYVVGQTFSPDFPVSNNILPIPASGYPDAVIAKFGQDRRQIFSTYYGGSDYDEGMAITVDIYNNVIATGHSNPETLPACSPTLCTTGHNPSATNNGWFDAWIAKFSSDGQNLTMSTFYGGSNYEFVSSITTNNAGAFTIGGHSLGSTPVPTPNTGFTHTHNGGANADGFLAQFDSNNDLVWATQLGGGGTSDDRIMSLWTDPAGNIYGLGTSNCNAGVSCTTITEAVPCTTYVGSDYPIGGIAGSYVVGNSGNYDQTIFKFNTGRYLAWSTFFGGDSWEYFNCGDIIAVPFIGDIIITGQTSSDQTGTVFPITYLASTGLNNNTLSGPTDAYIAMFNSSNAIMWSSYYGGSQNDAGISLSAFTGGEIYMLGQTNSQGLTVTPATTGAYYQPYLNQNSSATTNTDAFINRFHHTSYTLDYATYFGGAGNEDPRAVAFSQSSTHSDMVFVGHTTSPNTTPYPFPIKAIPWTTLEFNDPILDDEAAFITNFYNFTQDDRVGANTPSVKSSTNLKDKNVTVYPNPFNGNLFIKSIDKKINQIYIRDMMGKLVLSRQNLSVNLWECDLSHLTSGIYILETIIDESIFRSKIIMEK